MTTNGKNKPKNCIGIINLALKNKKSEIKPEKIKTTLPKTTEIIRNTQKKVE